MENQRKLNIILVIILSVFSLGIALCQHFSWHEDITKNVSNVVVTVVSLIAAAEVFCYEKWFDHDSFQFWLIVTAISGVSFLVTSFLGASNVIPDDVTNLLLQSFAFYIPTVIGSGLGWCARRIVDDIRCSSLWNRSWTC